MLQLHQIQKRNSNYKRLFGCMHRPDSLIGLGSKIYTVPLSNVKVKNNQEHSCAFTGLSSVDSKYITNDDRFPKSIPLHNTIHTPNYRLSNH